MKLKHQLTQTQLEEYDPSWINTTPYTATVEASKQAGLNTREVGAMIETTYGTTVIYRATRVRRAQFMMRYEYEKTYRYYEEIDLSLNDLIERGKQDKIWKATIPSQPGETPDVLTYGERDMWDWLYSVRKKRNFYPLSSKVQSKRQPTSKETFADYFNKRIENRE